MQQVSGSTQEKPFHVVLVGGSESHPGGIEAFCDRSSEALSATGRYRISRVPADTAYLNLAGSRFLMRGLGRLARLSRRNPDCVWVQYGNMADLAYVVAARLLRMRVLVTPHLGTNWRSQSSRVLRTLSAGALRFAHRLALISPTQEQEIALPPARPRSLIRNFLPSRVLTGPAETTGSTGGPLRLAHAGRLSAGKGTFTFVEVCAGLRDAGVEFTAEIAGGADDSTTEALASMVDDLGLREHISILGRVSDDELLRVLRSADVLLHLSRIDSYPLVVLEAIACSTLPLCLELAGARDMVDTYDGWIVSQAQPVGEAVAILASIDLTDVRRQGADAREAVRRDYSWDNAAGRLAAALESCAAARPA